MIIVGLTGSIGMGKSNVTKSLRRLGIPVHDADAAVHRIYQNPAIITAVGNAFPEVVRDGKIVRPKLSNMAFADPTVLSKLIKIFHPFEEAERKKFLRRCSRQKQRIVVFDMPLLFESGFQKSVDKVIVVSCRAFLQEQRVLARKGMTKEKFKAIKALQIPDAQKRQQADFIIDSGSGKRVALVQLKKILQALSGG